MRLPFTATAQNPPLEIVSAASGEKDALAPESPATAYGAQLATQSLSTQPGENLPTELGGTRVTVRDGGGMERAAFVTFVSPSQVNFLIPADAQPGQATVAVRAGDGTVSTGATIISFVAPALFTANGDGSGVPAGFVLRVKSDGAQSYESLAQFDEVSGRYRTRPIDLSPPNDQVFLVMFLSGIRRAADANGDGNLNESVRVIIGGDSFTPVFAGAVPGVAGLDQINLELEQSLSGRGRVSLSVTAQDTNQASRASKPAEIEIGGVTVLTGLAIDKNEVLAGESLEIAGNFQSLPATGVEVLFEGEVGDAPPFTAARDRLTVRVPFGVASGRVKISVDKRIVWTSPQDLRVRSSVSGFVQDTQKRGIAGFTVRLRDTGIVATTNQDGAFVLADAPPSNRSDLVFDPVPAQLPFPLQTGSLRVRARRDNQFQRLELQAITPPPTPSSGESESAAAGVDPIVVEPPLCPPGGVCPFVLTPFAPGRTPVDLPAGYFSSAIAQITPFATQISPARRLRLPNVDGVMQNQASSLRLFELDQKSDSPTLGQFVDIGQPSLSADGRYIETATNAVSEGSYYFASPAWPTATIIGHVVEADGQRPVRRAIVAARGQSVFSDSNGGFVLRNVPVINGNNAVTLEVSFHRPDGTVARAERAGVSISAGAQAIIQTDISLPPRAPNERPSILAPATLSITEGETRDFNFIATGLAAGALPELANPPSFAALRGLGAEIFALRLTPPSGSAGNYQITINAADARQTIAVTVIAAGGSSPIARAQSVTTDEDERVLITLSSNAGGTPSYSIVAPPLHGALTGTPPNVSYRPAANYNGTDSFSFKVGSGNDSRSSAVVSIAIRPVNDPPIINVPGPQTVSAGQTLKLTIMATDPDGDQLILGALNAPAGAPQHPPRISPNTWQFSWTPTVAQTGSYAVSFKVSDDQSPSLSDTGNVTITVSVKWAKTAGPEGGTINALFNDGANLFAGTDGGEVYRSSDQGQSWAAANTGLNSNTQVLALIGSGANLFAGTQGGGVFRSTNQGQSWMATSLTNRFVRAFALSGASLFAATDAGVFISTNQGQSFTPANSGLTSVNLSSMAVSGAAIFAGAGGAGITGGGVFVSTNQGQSWTAVNSGLTNLNTTSLAVNGAAVFAGTFGGGVFVSTNQGQSWTAVNGGLTNRGVLSLGVSGANLLAGTDGGGVFRSTNQGQSWTPINAGLTNLSVKTFAFISTNFFAGTFGGVFRSTNQGQSWTPVNTGLTSPQVFALAVSGNALLAGANGGGIAVSLNSGQNWTPGNAGLANQFVRALAVSGTNIFAGTAGGGVFRSSNQGQNWMPVNSGLPNLGVIALAVSGADLYAGSFGGGVARSTNQGQSWTPVNTGLSNPRIWTLVASGTNIFAGTEGGGVFRSTNQGQNWTPVNTGLPNLPVRAAAVNGASIFVGTSGGGAFVSTDQGNNWAPINTGLDPVVTELAVNGTTLFAGTFGGIFTSTNQGQNWIAINEGLTNPFVLTFAATGANLFAGAAGGVFLLTNQGQSWTPVNAGLGNKFVNAVAVKGDNYFAGLLGGVFRSTNQGANWAAVNMGLPSDPSVQSLAISGASLFAGTLDQGIYRSTNDGNSWTAVNSGLPARSGKPRAVYALKSNKAGLLAGTEAGVYRLDNFVTGSNWVAATGLPRDVRSLLVNNATVYAGTFDDGVYRSTDDGRTWQPAGKQGLGNLTILALGVSVNGASIFVGTDAGIYRSDDGGQSWRAVNRDLPANLVVTSFSISGAKLYAGSVYGVFLSEDNGGNWKQINAGLLDIFVTSFALSGDKLIAGAKVGGVFISRIPNQTACIGIAAQPADKTITSGQTATLAVTPSGDQPFQFQWYQGASGDFSRPIAGATASNFTTPALNATSNYWVLVTNGCGSAGSETAAVIVNATPQSDLAITQTISPVQPRPGDDLTFTLNVTNTGRDTAFSITVTDALPGQLTFSSCGATSGGLCGGGGNNRTVTFAALAPNAATTITLVAKVKADAGGATIRNTASVNAGTSDTNLANNTQTSSVTVQPPGPIGIEADVAPRPDGNGSTSVTDWTLIGRFAVGLDAPANGGEYQRADCAPRATFGNGAITVSDWAQAGRYAAGLDPPVPAAGPSAPIASALAEMSAAEMQALNAGPRQLRISAPGFDPGVVAIEALAEGDENALGFSLRFDPGRWRFAAAAVGEGAPGAALHLNTQQAVLGRVGIALALPPGRTLIAGLRSLVVLKFVAVEGSGATRPEIRFGDQPVARELVSMDAATLRAEWAPIASRELVNVSAASFEPRPLARGSIVAAFGSELAARTLPAEDLPLPASLGGTRVTITDNAGTRHRAPLFFVSPAQINYLLPAETAAGLAEVEIANADGTVARGVIEVEEVAPSLFTANADGQGIAAAVVLRVRADGAQRIESVAVFDPEQKKFIAAPINLSDENEQVFLVLFGTGWRNARGAQAVKAELGGEPLEAVFAGAQEGYPGLDQVNLLLPRSLRRRGEVALTLSVEGKAANMAAVKVR